MTEREKRSRGEKWKNKRVQSDGRGTLKQRVKTARGRTTSSTNWLERQLNDPYVVAAKNAGYRSRSAFKLIQIDDRFGFLKRGGFVVDLGAAPGGWTQVAVERIGRKHETDMEHVLAIDIDDMDPVAAARIVKLDILAPNAPSLIKQYLSGDVSAVLSDMAAPATGHRQTDHARVIALCEAGLALAMDVLTPGGTFVAKVLRGGTEHELLAEMKRHFGAVRHFKPEASRADSAEMYVVATAFQGS